MTLRRHLPTRNPGGPLALALARLPLVRSALARVTLPLRDLRNLALARPALALARSALAHIPRTRP